MVFETCGSGIRRDASVVRDLLGRAGVLFPDEGDCDWAMVLPLGSVSGAVLEVDGSWGLQAGLPAPEFGSKH